MSEEMNQRLRTALQHITGSGVSPADHRELVSRLPYAHAIEPLGPDPEIGAKLENYTCFMHAFDIADSEPVIKIASTFDEVFPSPEFIEYLIDTRLCEVPEYMVVDGDVVVYFREGRPRHAGKLDRGRIVSKWGTGHMWRHPLFEVPSHYGGAVRFFRQAERCTVEEAFVVWASAKAGADAIERVLAS